MSTQHRIAALVVAACVLPAIATGQGGVYAGVVVDGNLLEVDYSKTVDVQEGALVADPPRGSRSDSFADAKTGGGGVLFGYRYQYSSFYASAEAQAFRHVGAASGSLPGTGMQRGENWPEDWTLSQRYSADFTSRVGKKVGPINLYALVGVRLTGLGFHADFTGCEHPKCSRDGTYPDFYDDVLERDSTDWGLTAGGGLEWPCDDNVAVRIELSYTDYGTAHFRSEFDKDPAGMPSIIVSSQLVGNEKRVSLSVIRYF